MDEFIGTIQMWPMSWAPKGWALCDGAILPISSNTALFSLIGTTYGGNGTTTFALPDLRGRMPIGMGAGPGLSPRVLGQQLGHETTTLTTANMPAHSHTLSASNTAAGLTQAPAAGWTPGSATWADNARPPVATPVTMYTSTVTNPVPSAPSSAAGNGMPVENMPPALCINYIICLYGVFPSRP